MYAFAIPAGQLTIRPGRNEESCELWLNEELVAQFESAGAAARLIAEKHTGRIEIDDADVMLPRNVESWNWIPAGTT